ncbi:MAG: efflux RND transporter periplasmic adaptor subunit [Salinivirgaceae bacterium]
MKPIFHKTRTKELTSKLTLLVVVFIVFTNYSCSNKSAADTEINTEAELTESTLFVDSNQIAAGAISLGYLTLHPFYEQVKSSGYFEVKPSDKVSISSYLGGTVNQISVNQGQWVQKGDLLFTLQTPEFINLQQRFIESKSKFEFLEQAYLRQQKLNSEQVTSDKDLQQLKSDYLTAQASYLGLMETLKLLNINPETVASGTILSSLAFYAPISGHITEISINRGSFLSPEMTAMELINTKNMYLRIRVFEKDVALIKSRQTVWIEQSVDSKTILEGSVMEINRKLSETNGAANVFVAIKDVLNQPLIAGMYANAFINVSETKKMALPLNSVVSVDGVDYVLTKKADQNDGWLLEKHVVVTGLSDKNYIEISNTSDFAENTPFVVSGAYNLIQE